LAAVGSGTWARQRLQGVRQVVRVVGQGGEVLALQYQRSGVVVRLDAQARAGLALDRHFLLLGGAHFHLNGKLEGVSSRDGHHPSKGEKPGNVTRTVY